MVGLVKYHAVPRYLRQRQVLAEHSVGGNDDWCAGDAGFGEAARARSVVDERVVAKRALYRGDPLTHERLGEDNQGATLEVAQHDPEHLDRFAETHLVGHYAATHATILVRRELAVDTPRYAFMLVRFRVHSGTFQQRSES